MPADCGVMDSRRRAAEPDTVCPITGAVNCGCLGIMRPPPVSFLEFVGRSSAVEHWTFNPLVVGSIPPDPHLASTTVVPIVAMRLDEMYRYFFRMPSTARQSCPMNLSRPRSAIVAAASPCPWRCSSARVATPTTSRRPRPPVSCMGSWRGSVPVQHPEDLSSYRRPFKPKRGQRC